LKNPYVIDRPLNQTDMFFGRDALLKRILDSLVEGHRLVFLFGLPLMGKTSFVNYLTGFLGDRYEVVRVPLDTNAVRDRSPLWTTLVRVCRALRQPEPDPSTFASEGEPYAIEYARWLAARAGLHDRVVCLDDLRSSDLAPDGDWARDLLVLRDVFSSHGSVRLLVAVQGLPAQIVNPALDECPQLVLTPLTETESTSLLMAPVRGALAYDIDVVKQVCRLSGGHPLFVQIFGYLIFERRQAAGWVGKSEADDVLPRAMELGAPYFETLWNDSSPAERLTLTSMAEMWGHHGVAAAKDVHTYLGKLGVRIPREDVDRAFDLLYRRGIVERLGGSTYRVVDLLSAEWIKTRHTTLDTVDGDKHYRRTRPEPTQPTVRRHIDLTGIGLWALAGLLVFAIAYVWQGRQRQEMSGLPGSAPPMPSASPTHQAAGLTMPTPETGAISGWIAYQGRDDANSNWDIYVMRADGSDPVRLTDAEYDDTDPAWSPHGRQIAFVSGRDGNREIYLMNEDGNEQQNLTNNAADDWTPAWSPDGQYLAFASFRDGNWELYVMDSDGTNQHRLTWSQAADYDPCWSPDGSSIAFVSDRTGNLDIHILSMDSGQVAQFTDDPATDQAPAYSPDGSRLLWESYRDDNMEIYVANVDGSQGEKITREAYADDRGGAWSPWGNRIAFYSNRDDGWDIFALNLDTGVVTNITQSPTLETSPAWGPQ